MRGARSAILQLISENERLLRTAVKAAAALLLPALLARLLPVPDILGRLPVLLGAALAGAVLPDFVLVLICAAWTIAGLAAFAPEAGICGGVIVVFLLLVFFGFTGHRGLTACLFLIGMCLHFPFAVLAPAVLLGGGPQAAACLLTAAAYYAAASLLGMDVPKTGLSAESLDRIPQMLEGLLGDRRLLIGCIVLLAAALAILVIRLIPASGARYFAVCAGTICFVLLRLMELNLQGNAPWAVLPDAAAGLVTGLLAAWLFPGPDYKRACTLEFEDDDYYYTVRAVPKIGAGSADRPVPPARGRERRNEEA